MKKIISQVLFLIFISTNLVASSLMDSTSQKRDTLMINGNKYVKISIPNNDKIMAKYYKEFIKCLLSIKGDTIIPAMKPHQDGLFANYISFGLKDINEDGKLDIEVGVFFNAGDIYDTYFFDSKTNNFRLVVSQNKPIKLLKGGKNYFYNYYDAGCAGANSYSFLYKLIDFALVEMGRIEEYKCDDDINKHKVSIYKKGK